METTLDFFPRKTVSGWKKSLESDLQKALASKITNIEGIS